MTGHIRVVGFRRLLVLVLLFSLWDCSCDEFSGSDGVEGDGGPDIFGNASNTEGGVFSTRDATVVDIDCGSDPFGAEAPRANVMLIIDKSGSMLEAPSGFDKDKWSSMKDAVAKTLESVQDDLYLGLQLYPDPDGCNMPVGSDMTVDVQAGTDALPEIVSALDGATPGGGTPTLVALERALAYFTTGAGADLEGQNFVLLATDGGPNCNSELSCDADACTANLDGLCPITNCCDPSIDSEGATLCLDADGTEAGIAALLAAGIPTFVVGIPGSEIYEDSLDALAEAGGRSNPDGPPMYYAVSSATGVGSLASVLSAITAAVITTCRLQLTSDPPNLLDLNVEIEGEVLPQKGADGWELDTGTSPPTVVIKGATCDKIEDEGVSAVEVTFGCPTIIE